MRPCARSCSTETDSPGSPTCPRRAEPMRVLAVRALRLGRREARRAPAGTVLGHEVVARRADGARVALIHHLPCGDVRALPRRARVDVRALRRADDRPGRLRRGRWPRPTGVELPDGVDDATRHLRRAARVRAPRRRARAARPRARRRARLRRRGSSPRCCAGAATTSSRSTRTRSAPGRRPTARSTPPSSARRPRRSTPSRPAAPSSSSPPPARSTSTSLPARADADRLALGDAAAHGASASALLPELDLPEPTVLPLERFAEGLELYRSGRALKVVFTP